MGRSRSEHSFSRPFYEPLSPPGAFEGLESLNGLAASTSKSFEPPNLRKGQMDHERRFYVERSDIENLKSPSWTLGSWKMTKIPDLTSWSMSLRSQGKIAPRLAFHPHLQVCITCISAFPWSLCWNYYYLWLEAISEDCWIVLIELNFFFFWLRLIYVYGSKLKLHPETLAVFLYIISSNFRADIT